MLDAVGAAADRAENPEGALRPQRRRGVGRVERGAMRLQDVLAQMAGQRAGCWQGATDESLGGFREQRERGCGVAAIYGAAEFLNPALAGEAEVLLQGHKAAARLA